MNYRNKYTFQITQPEDMTEILNILEESDFKGKINLTYTRRPDPIKSFKCEADESIVFKAKDCELDKIIGIGTCSIRKYYINGKITKVGYLTGLRIKKEYQKKFVNISEAYKYLYSIISQKNIDYFYTTILEENKNAQKLLEKKRPSMPEYQFISDYEVVCIKTGVGFSKKTEYVFSKATKQEYQKIIKFINDYGEKKQLYPIVDSAILEGSLQGLNGENFYILKDKNEEIVACAAVWDQVSYKQYILNGYSGIFKYMYPFTKIFNLFGYIDLPKPGSILNFFNISFVAIKDDNKEVFKSLISSISCEMRRKYSFFTLGLVKDNIYYKLIKSIPHISYKSKIYMVDFKKDQLLENKILKSMPFYLESAFL